MKKLISTVIILSMALVPVGSAYAAQLPEKTISVSGRGVVTAQPDTAEINFSVTTEADTSSQAQSKNNEIYKKVVTALKAEGISESDIKTQWNNVYPNIDYTNGRKITGYRADNSFVVSTNDKDNTGKYIDAALKAGVTGVNGVNFSIKNPQQYYAQALKLAVKNAGESAEAIKEAIGAGELKVYSIEEQPNGYSYITSSAMAKNESAMDSGAGVPTEISYDDIEISAYVNAVYSY